MQIKWKTLEEGKDYTFKKHTSCLTMEAEAHGLDVDPNALYMLVLTKPIRKFKKILLDNTSSTLVLSDKPSMYWMGDQPAYAVPYEYINASVNITLTI